MPKQIITWETKDGKRFTSEEQADYHEAAYDLKELCHQTWARNGFPARRTLESNDIAEILLDNADEFVEVLNRLTEMAKPDTLLGDEAIVLLQPRPDPPDPVTSWDPDDHK